jgi:hypothetical protein
MKVCGAREAWDFLISNPEKTKVASSFGHINGVSGFIETQPGALL